jgi:hypothetical protein
VLGVLWSIERSSTPKDRDRSVMTTDPVNVFVSNGPVAFR